MKFFILSILILGNMHTIFTDQDFRKEFLNWQKGLTKAQKESMKDFIAGYDKAYQAQDKNLLSYFQAAFQKIMDQWGSLYKPLTEAKIFNDSVKQFIAQHPSHKVVKQYLSAYDKFDQMPTDPKRYTKLLDAQKNLKTIINRF
ncbi:hypothetical protein HYV10_00840 [Candidatus Dependentiae bacterium]|nr:hypothetical protein [Candidatus Dependentiae bacterium]